jgi:hypothetical protein
MSDPTLILRRANMSRTSGYWQDDDYDVFDGGRCVGRIYLVDRYGGNETWFWGLAFECQRPARKSHGCSESLEHAKAAFRAEYGSWKGTQRDPVESADGEAQPFSPKTPSFPSGEAPAHCMTAGLFLLGKRS